MKTRDICYKRLRQPKRVKEQLDKLANDLSNYGVAFPDRQIAKTFKNNMRKYGRGDVIQTSIHPRYEDKRIITIKRPNAIKIVNSAKIRIVKKE